MSHLSPHIHTLLYWDPQYSLFQPRFLRPFHYTKASVSLTSRISGFSTNSPPEESPTIRIDIRHLGLGGRSASVGTTGAIRCTVRAIILMIRDEDRESLSRRCSSVVRAFRGLDRGGHFRGYEVVSTPDSGRAKKKL